MSAFGLKYGGISSTTSTSPEDWFFEMWNRDELPPWKAIGVNYSFHHCVFLLHSRRLFAFVKMLAELKSHNPSAVDLSLDLKTLESIDLAFQSCRNSAEHICVMTKCIVDSTDCINVYPAFIMQALFNASLVLVMLIASRPYRYIHCQQWSPNGFWDSEIDDDTVERYFEWLDMFMGVIEANMFVDGARGIIRELELLLRKLKRGEVVIKAAVEACKGGLSVEDAVATTLRDDGSNKEFWNGNVEEEDPIGGLSEDLKSVMVLETLRDIRNHTNALAEVVDKSTVASLRSVSVSAASCSGSPAVSIGDVFQGEGIGEGESITSPDFAGFGREVVDEREHMAEALTASGGNVVVAGEGLVGVDVTNESANYNWMHMGIDNGNGVDGDFGLANVANTVDEFLDLISMEWSGENGQTGEDFAFEG
ncbi:hypothetical protein HDU76_009613, partial [Blyttiomyces sp. JEL0837]